MNTKIKKISLEMIKIKEKQKELQEKYHDLENQKIELENLEIIGVFRNSKIPTEDIAKVIASFKAQTKVPFFNEEKELEKNEENKYNH